MQFSYNALGQEFLRQSQAGFANSSHYTATGLLAHQRAGRGTESFLQSLHDNPLQLPISTDVHRGYQYDKAFNLVNIDDARWNRTQYHYNANDQIVETQYSNQFVSWAGRLNTWGQMAFWQSHDDYADNDPEYTECHFRFAGQYEDKESGLYYNRFRYYDKDTGQYISPDPIGLLGGFNPYGYVHCPTGWVDPFGLAGGQGNKGEVESFYRSMSSAHYEHLINKNQLKPTSETFLSPTLGFSESYTGILVRFDLKPGTTKALENIGVRDISKATRETYPDMPIISKGWNKFNAYFKAEGEQINIGLGKGKALEIFNDNIKRFEKLKEIKKD